MPEHPKETIITIAKENLILRWLTIFLGIGMLFLAGASYILSHKPQLVWVVTEDGKIMNTKGKVFYWEIETAARKAIESYYIASPAREQMLGQYFSSPIAESAKEYTPRDRMVLFQVLNLEHRETEIKVEGTLVRINEPDQKLYLTLIKTDRTELNPFGLRVVKAGKVEDVKEEKKEGLAAVVSSTPTRVQDSAGSSVSTESATTEILKKLSK